MPSGCTRETDAVAIEVGNFQAEDHLAEGCLVRRALHKSLVEPRTEEKRYQSDPAAQNSEWEMGKADHRPCQSQATEDFVKGANYDPQNDRVDNRRQHSD